MEKNAPESNTIVEKISDRLLQCFSGSRQPKSVTPLLKQMLQLLNKSDEARKREFLTQADKKPIHENEFIKFFLSEHVMGSTQMYIKKLQENKGGPQAQTKMGAKDADKKKEAVGAQVGQVPVKFNYMPNDLTYAYL